MKKALSIILAVTFILSAVTGCGNKTPEVISETVRLPERPAPCIIAENIVTLATQQYVTARLYLDALTEFDINTSTIEEFAGLYDGTIEQFELAEQYAAKAVEAVELARIYLDAGGETKTTGALKLDPFVMTAYAADPERRTAAELKQWAQDIQSMVNNIPDQYGEKGMLITLGNQLGVDAGTAKDMLKQAKTINEGSAAVSEADKWAWWSDFHDAGMKSAQATKTGCKAALLVTGTIATGGAVGAVATTALVVKGADAVVEVGATASTILLGEDHSVTTTLKDVQAYTAPAAAIAGLVTLDFSTAADKISSIDYIAHSLRDYLQDDKILCVDVQTYKDAANEAKDITIGIYDIAAAELAGEPLVKFKKINTTLAEAKLPTLPDSMAPGAEPPAPKPPLKKAAETAPKADVKSVDDYIKDLVGWMVEMGFISPDDADKYLFSVKDIAGTYAGMIEVTDYVILSEDIISVEVDEPQNCEIIVTPIEGTEDEFIINIAGQAKYSGKAVKQSDGNIHFEGASSTGHAALTISDRTTINGTMTMTSFGIHFTLTYTATKQ